MTEAKAALHMLKVPPVSMSNTVLKPLEVKSSAGHRKLHSTAQHNTQHHPISPYPSSDSLVPLTVVGGEAVTDLPAAQLTRMSS